MTALTDRIAEVLREHPLSTAAWGQTHCWCQQNLAADDFGMSYERHAAHVAQRVEAELQLTEEKHTYADYETKAVSGGEGIMRYGGQTSRYVGQKTVRRWVSEWRNTDGA